jgi:hypothetical protein
MEPTGDGIGMDTVERLAQLWKFGVAYNGSIRFSNGFMANVMMEVPHRIYSSLDRGTVIVVDNLCVKKTLIKDKIPLAHPNGEIRQHEPSGWERLESSSFLGKMIYDILNDFYVFGQVASLQVDRRKLNGESANRNDVTSAGLNSITVIFMTGESAVTSKVGIISKQKVFWSGGGNPNVVKAAMKFAKENGAETLEMTTKGKLLTAATRLTSYDLTKPFWEQASKSFAKGASGSVH